jgi:circadian clock protein KaiC
MTTTPQNHAENGGQLSTGISGLDDVLLGGLPADHLYLIEGSPGTGKTTLALQFLLEGAREGGKGLYVTLSESKDELVGVARSHNWSLDGIELYEMSAQDEQELAPEVQYTVFHPAEVELADTTNSVLKKVAEMAPSRVVFDSLSELRMLARDPLRYRRQILALKRYFADKRCTVLLLDDRTAEGNDLQLQSIAHGVIMMQSLEREYGVKRRRLEIRKLRGQRFREGFHDYTIETGGVVVFPRLFAPEHRSEIKLHTVSSGIKELDSLLGGGLDSGTSSLLIGPAGSGKSTIALCFAVAAAERGEKAAVYTFDETLSTLKHRALGFGIPIDRLMEDGKMLLQQVDPAELSPGEFIHNLMKLVEDSRYKIVVIDSLNGFLNAMPGESYLLMQMHELLSYLNQLGVVTIMTMAQHGFIGSGINSPVDVSYLADCVLLFRYFEAEGKVKQALSVVKKRTGEHERTIREMVFSDGKIRVGGPLIDFEGVLTGVPRFGGKTSELVPDGD